MFSLGFSITLDVTRVESQAVARGSSGPLGNVDHAALKPALRALVRGLERGQAEALWILYLRLFAILPGKGEEALSMAEHAVE